MTAAQNPGGYICERCRHEFASRSGMHGHQAHCRPQPCAPASGHPGSPLCCPRCAGPVARDREEFVCLRGGHGTVTPEAVRYVTPEEAISECEVRRREVAHIAREKECPGCHGLFSVFGIAPHVRFCRAVRA